MTASSNQTTGNVPVEAIDPGGTRAAPTGNANKSGKSDLHDARPAVRSGDQNDHVERATGPDDSAGRNDPEPAPGAPR